MNSLSTTNAANQADRSNEWHSYLRRLALLLTILVGIAATLHLLTARDLGIALAYSLAIGLLTFHLCYAGVLIGRHFTAPGRQDRWAVGSWYLGLLIAGNIAGILIGTAAIDAWLGRNTWADADNAPVTLLVSAFAAVGFGYLFLAQNRQHLQAAAIARSREEATEARLRLLQSQLEPHMLFNTLANLRVLITVDPAQAQSMLDRLVAFLQATLEASRSQATHPLGAELALVRDYLSLMKIRMGERFGFEIECSENLLRHPLPPLILQPIVENAILHGLEPKIGEVRLQIRVTVAGGTLCLEVVDDGIGLPAGASDATVSQGFGTAHVRERLRTLYGESASLEIAPVPAGGTRAVIRLPAGPGTPEDEARGR